MRVPMRRKVRAALIAALIAALLLAGLAYAASRSRILERLFPSGNPSQAAEQLVKPVGTGKIDGPYSFSIDECLFDGNELHVEWTAKSQAGDLAIFTASGLDFPFVNLSQQNHTGSLQFTDFVPLGDTLNGRAISREYHGYTVVTLPDGIGSEPFDATLRGAFMKPVAPIVRDEDIRANIACRPTWIASQDKGQTYLHFASIVALEDGCQSQEAPDVGKYLDALTPDSSQKEWMGAYVNALAAAGYAQELTEMALTFTVSPDFRRIYHTEIDGPSTFEFDDRTVAITKAEFTAAHTDLEGLMLIKGSTTEKDLFKLFYELRPDGKKTDARINSQEDSYCGDAGLEGVTISQWGDPLPEAPSYVLLEAYWYPDGFLNDSTGKKATPMRAPEYDITLKLKKVP